MLTGGTALGSSALGSGGNNSAAWHRPTLPPQHQVSLSPTAAHPSEAQPSARTAQRHPQALRGCRTNCSERRACPSTSQHQRFAERPPQYWNMLYHAGNHTAVWRR